MLTLSPVTHDGGYHLVPPTGATQWVLLVCFIYVIMYCYVLVPHHVPTPTRRMALRASRSRPATPPEPELEPERYRVTSAWMLWLVKALL